MPIIRSLLFCNLTLVQIDSHSDIRSVSSEEISSLRTRIKTPPPRRLRSLRYAVKPSGKTSLDFMLVLSQDSVPHMMSGLM